MTDLVIRKPKILRGAKISGNALTQNTSGLVLLKFEMSKPL
jgi:hypothetical protein